MSGMASVPHSIRKTNTMRIDLTVGCFLMAITVAACSYAAEPVSGVPASRLARLTKGVNLGAFRYRPDTTLNKELAARLQAMGLRHVRLPVFPDTLIDEAHPEALKPDGLRRLDGTLDLLLEHKLAVIVDMHDPDKRLWNDPAYGDKFVVFWESLARHLSKRDPERVFLEVANEPISDSPQYWNALQGRLLTAMRKGAPRHTLVATPNMQITAGNWDQLKSLETLEPYPDRNVVYTFHFYEPFVFTHQGATWTWDVVRGFKAVPYPSSPEAVAPLLSAVDDAARPHLENYGRERWDAKRVRAAILPFVEWGRRHKVSLTCNEFGVLRTVSPEPDRNAWISDVRRALEAERIPWTMWDDGGGFGVTIWRDGTWHIDGAAVSAIGLKAPRTPATP